MVWMKKNFAWMSKPSSSFHTADAVHMYTLAEASPVGALIQLHVTLVMFSVVGGKLVSTAGKLALSFMISDTAVLFKPFWFQRSLTRVCFPCLILLVQSMLTCKRKIILCFWHWLSQLYLAYLSWLLPVFGYRSCQRARLGLYGWSSVNSKGWREDSVHVIFSTKCLRKSFWRHLLSFCTQRPQDFQPSFDAWLLSWNHPSFPLFLTCPIV